MRLSPDEMIFWQHGFLKLNGTIVFTWGLMLVLAVGFQAHHAQAFHRSRNAPAGRTFWKSSSPASRSKSKKSACAIRRSISAFWARSFCSSPLASLCTVIPGYEPPTGSLSTTAALALCVFVAVPLFGIEEQGLGGYLKSYVEPTVIMLPFNIISELSRTLALAVRLFGNMMSGAMIIGILLTITPFIFPIVMTRARPAHRHGAGLHLQHPGRGLYRGRHARPQAQAGPMTSLKHEQRQQQETTMDNMTLIAIASIVTAGLTTGFGCMGPRSAKGARSPRRSLRWRSSPTPPPPSPAPCLSAWR